jgi:outer membrane protein TolC
MSHTVVACLMAVCAMCAVPAAAQTPWQAEEPEPLVAPDPGPLTLSACLERALAYNKTLIAARKSAERYGYLTKSYRANFFPNFKLTGADVYSNSRGALSIAGGYLPTYTFNATAGTLVPNVVTDATGAPVMGADGVPVFKEYAYFPDQDITYKVGNIVQAGITVEQPIYMGGKVTAAYRMARIGAQMAEQNTELQESEVVVKTEQAYMLVVKTSELQRVAQRYNTMLQELLANVQSAYKHGMTSNNDVLKVQVKLNESELKLRQAENAGRLAQMNLCHVIGLPLDSTVAVRKEDIMGMPEVPSARADVTSRPEYSILDGQVALAAQQVKLDRSDYLPQVAVAGAYSYVHGFEVNDKDLFYKPSYGVMLSVSVPLFHFGEGLNKVRASRKEQERIAAQRDELIEQMQLELVQAANNLDEAFLEVTLTEKSMEAADENLRTGAREYELGLESLVNYMEAQTMWQQAYADKIDARCRLFLAGTAYRKAAGMNTVGRLNSAVHR